MLELGCGWGSLTLWMAEHYPEPQRDHRGLELGLAARQFIQRGSARRSAGSDERRDRDLRHERVHHRRALRSRRLGRDVRAHAQLGGRCCGNRRAGSGHDGRVFLHVFAHRASPTPSRPRTSRDWMSRHFFTGGMMPSGPDRSSRRSLRGRGPLERVDGDALRAHVRGLAARTSTRTSATRSCPILRVDLRSRGAELAGSSRWRVFFLACAELFGYERGQRVGRLPRASEGEAGAPGRMTTQCA